METTYIMPIYSGKGKTIEQRFRPSINNFKNRVKRNKLEAAYKCTPNLVDAEFLLAEAWNKVIIGRAYWNDVIAYQVCQTFTTGELTPEEANSIGYEFAMRFTKGEHAFVVYTHVKKKYIHNKIYWNSTTLDRTGKFQDFRESSKAVRELSELICSEHGISVIENP